jgi:5-formyltetrahydrofolate cyclo-ligase
MSIKSKDELRRRFLSLRNSMSKEERLMLSKVIQERLLSLSEFKKSSIVGCYSAIGSEVDTSIIASHVLIQGKVLAYPRVLGMGKMEFRAVSDPMLDLTLGKYSILEPLESCKLIEPDLLIVPAIAWDEHGYRIGYGKGYYDRYMKSRSSHVYKTSVYIGLAYDFQVISSIPHTIHDAKVDIIVTEKRVIYTDEH